VGAGGVEPVRRLALVLGDQLDRDSKVFDGLDRERDAVLMIESRHEATFVPQHKQRLMLFFSAMRHFRDELRERGHRVLYSELDGRSNLGALGEEVPRWLRKTRAQTLVVSEPGDYRVRAELRGALRGEDARLEIVQDEHFLCSQDAFSEFADDRKGLRLETFYRWMRRRHGVLVDGEGRPEGERWNYDGENRETFGAEGPPEIKAPRSFRWDDVTREVAALVDREFPDHPGSTRGFDWPVTTKQANAALRDFVEHRLRDFGPYQDAMVDGHPYLYHSRLSASLKLHLLHPRRAIERAVAAYEDGAAPIHSVEGFVRQILGWREFVRGVYWREMPDYADRNALAADRPMPAFMWTGETEMRCVGASIEQLLEFGYAHHIQRLMVLGLFALLLGVEPRAVNAWHLALYVDAIDWVSAPNVLGMSQYADGGLFASKPYCGSGAYINRMSDYCGRCRFDPKKSTGTDACPFTTLYWDFLSRNRNRLRNNPRMALQYRNLDKKSRSERRAVRRAADCLKESCSEAAGP